MANGAYIRGVTTDENNCVFYAGKLRDFTFKLSMDWAFT